MATIPMARPVARRALPTARGTAKAARVMMAGSRRVGEMQGRAKARRRSGRGRLATFAAGTSAGVAAEYLLDPEQGKRRRHMVRDRAISMLRRGSRETERQARYMAGKAQGTVAEATPPGRDSSELNDPALEAKVESELFRPAGAPKDSVSVNVENGVVFLRGEVDSCQMLDEVLGEARAIDGVSRVESLLHLPGEPAPRKS